MDFVFDAITDLLNDTGVQIVLTKVATGQSYRATGAYLAVNTKEMKNKASLIQMQQSKLYLAAGRFVPEIGDYVVMNSRQFQVKVVDAKVLQGKPVYYVLELT